VAAPIFNPFFHTVSIHQCEGPSPDFVGSGVLLRIEGRDYIATAAHVIDELPNELGIAVVKHEIKGCKSQPSRIFASKQADGNYKEGLDLALLSVPGNYRQFIEGEEMSFFDLDANNPPPVTDVCIVSGFPAKKNYYDHRKRRYAPTCGAYHIQSYMEDPERVREIGGDPARHFALEINKRGDFRDGITDKPIPELFDLHGMSGGGVWHMERGTGEGFPACATALAGIIVEDWDTKRDRRGMAKVVKIEEIRNVLNFARSRPETLFFVQ
jgi:hypothetical protein